MVAFGSYMGKLYDAVSRILDLNISAQSVIVSMDRMNTLRSEPDEAPLMAGTISNPGVINSIYMDKINFAYKDEEVLRGLVMRIQGPGFYVIVGKNGSGKSTLFKILMGFYDHEGSILFGTNRRQGISINDMGHGA
jgi:ABC-type bacteriocin/lantibiotic exporter with double-glycine peptidase domain